MTAFMIYSVGPAVVLYIRRRPCVAKIKAPLVRGALLLLLRWPRLVSFTFATLNFDFNDLKIH
jgi:hypothetical protein